MTQKLALFCSFGFELLYSAVNKVQAKHTKQFDIKVYKIKKSIC